MSRDLDESEHNSITESSNEEESSNNSKKESTNDSETKSSNDSKIESESNTSINKSDIKHDSTSGILIELKLMEASKSIISGYLNKLLPSREIKKNKLFNLIIYDLNLGELNELLKLEEQSLISPKFDIETYMEKKMSPIIDINYMQSITLPHTLTKIDTNTFNNSIYLNEITFLKNENDQNDLEYIGLEAFHNTKIQTISIPANVLEIQSNCFPKTLKSIEFENGTPSLNDIGDGLFSYTQLESFSMPLNADIFLKPRNIFLKCKNLKTIIFDKFNDENNSTEINYEDDEQIDIEKMNKYNEKIQAYSTKWIESSGNCGQTDSDSDSDDLVDFISFYSDKLYITLCSFHYIIYHNINAFKTNDFAKSYLLCQANLENLEVTNFNLNRFYFYNMPNLINIKIPKSDNCRYVKINGCLYTKNMKKLIIAERNIKSAVINSKCNIITNYALSIESLEKVTFEENSELQEISFCVFSKSQIKSLVIPDSVKRIDYGVFDQCNKLESCKLPNSINLLDICTFSYTNLYEITIPKNVVKIAYGCFFKCFNLTNVIFEKNSKLIEIGDFAFAYTKIESISIPKSVCIISCYCFEGCENLKKIHFDKDSKFNNFEWNSKEKKLKEHLSNPIIDSSSIIIKNGLHYNNFGKNLVYFDFSVQKVTISKETEIIKESALKFSNIEKIEFESGILLKEIEASAFEFLHIQEISIPKTVTIIGDSVFRNCKFLQKVNIDLKSQLNKIGDHAFEGTQIKTINFPSTLTSIGDYAFFECFTLQTVYNHSKKIDFGIRSFSNSSIENIKFPQEIVFHDFSFSGCLKLHHLAFIDKPMKIIFGENSFENSGLKELDLNCICFIHENAFTFCEYLKEVVISKKESIIHQSSFYNSNVHILKIKCKIFNNKFDDNSENVKKLSMIKKSNRRPIYNDRYNLYRHYLDWEKKLDFEKRYKSFIKFADNFSDDIYLCGQLYRSRTFEDYFYLSKLYNHFLNFNKIQLAVYYTDQNDNSKSFSFKYLSNQNCHIVNNVLKYVYLIDNISLFEKPENETNKNEIKKNEIIKVPNVVKKFDFDPVPHIKKIIWEPDCIIEDLGPPGFFSYSNLIEIEIPKLVKIIPPHLFDNCHFLKTVLFDKDSILKEIGEFSFANTRIEKVSLPKSVKIIHRSAFMNNSSLKEVNFYGKIIEDEAFYKTGITTFTLSNETKSIGNYVFQYCRSLTTINIDPKNSELSNIGSYAFAETSITRIDIPSKIKIINEGTFSGCESLKEVKIAHKSKLKEIKQYSFVDNVLLEEINIPKKINIISPQAFINTPSLKCIMKQSNKKYFVMKDYSIYSPKRELIFVPRNLESFKVMPKCHVICEGAFCGPNLKSVTFSDESLKTIKKRAFAHSTGLKEIKIPKSIKYIGEEAFIDCQNLETVELDLLSKLVEIPKFCFAFSGLKKIMLPIYIGIINDSSFLFCQQLKEINLYEINISYIGNFAFTYTNIEAIKFPFTIKYIGFNAFEGIKSLQVVDFSQIGQINIQNVAYKFYYKKILDESKDSMNKLHKILSRFNFDRSNNIINDNIVNNHNENKIEPSNPRNKKSKYTIQSTKTTSKSSKKTKISAEIIKPLSKSKRKTNENPHQISQPSIQNMLKSPRRLHKISKITSNDENYSVYNEEHFEKIIDNKIEKILKTQFDDIFDDEFDDEFENKYEKIAQNKKYKEIVVNKKVGQKTITEKIIKESKEKFKEIHYDDQNRNESNDKNISVGKQSKKSVKKIFSNLPPLNNEKDRKQQLKKVNEFEYDNSNDDDANENNDNDYNNDDSNNGVDENDSDNGVDDDNMKIKNIKKIVKEKHEKKVEVNVENKIIKEPSDDDDIDEEKSHDIREKEEEEEEEEEEETKEEITQEEFEFEDESSEESSNESREISNCYIHPTSFIDSPIKIFKFNLNEYKWFSFFNYCHNIEEYIVNPNFHLYLQKQEKENSQNTHILGNYYKLININFEPQILPFQYVTEFNRSRTIKMINPFYFFDLSQLTIIELDDDIKLKEIPKKCFALSSLKEITIPISLRKINQSAFKDCYNLKRVNISKKCKLLILHSFAFSGCRKLTKICIPNKVCHIYQHCFSYSGLISIELPSSLCKIGKYSFYNCKSLNKIILNEGLIELGESSFAYNISLKSISLPNTLKTIKSSAFSNCYNLTNVKTSKNTQLINIYNCAFQNTQIEELKINRSAQILFEPLNVPKLNKISFYQGDPINFIQLNDGTIYKKMDNDIFLNQIFKKSYFITPEILSALKESICKKKDLWHFLDSFEINPPKCNNIKRYFYYARREKYSWTSLYCCKKIYFKKFVRELMNSYIFHCNDKIEILNYINSMPLNSPEMESEIKKRIFDYLNCKYKYFRCFYKEIDNKSFDYLLNYYINEYRSLLLKKNRSTVLDQKKRPVLELVFAPKNLTSLKIHEDCFLISNSILDGMKNLSTIEYMKGSTNLIQNFPNYNHFYTGKYNKIKKIKISGNFTYMEKEVFSYFNSLEVVEFDELTNIYFIPKFAFYECKNLCKINIPSSCFMISERAFKNCVNLKSIEFMSNNEPNLECILDEAFYNCSSLESIKIPSSILIIKNGAFMNCSKLKRFEFFKTENERLSIIEKNAFRNCTSLELFHLPQSCLYLGPASFLNCTNLKTFECKNCNLNSINCRTFYNCKSLTKFELTNLQYKNIQTEKIDKKTFDSFENFEYRQNLYSKCNQFNIFDEAFMNCSSLKNVVIEDKSKLIDTITKEKYINDNLIFQKSVSYSGIQFIINKSQKIHRYAFKNCKSLTNLRLLIGNLEFIHEDAFENCSSLKTIEINSFYWRSIISKSLNMPNDINILLFNNGELTKKSFKIVNQIKKKLIQSYKKGTPNLSLLDWPVSDDIEHKIKMRSTCINSFDGPQWSLRSRVEIHNYIMNVSSESSDSEKNYYHKLYHNKSKKYYFSEETKYNYPFEKIEHIQTEYKYNIVPKQKYSNVSSFTLSCLKK